MVFTARPKNVKWVSVTFTGLPCLTPLIFNCNLYFDASVTADHVSEMLLAVTFVIETFCGGLSVQICACDLYVTHVMIDNRIKTEHFILMGMVL